MSYSDRLSRTCFSTICWAQWPCPYPNPNPREKERDWERFFFFEQDSIMKAEAAASHYLNHFGVLSDRTKVAFALLTFAHLTFALLSHSHCCLLRTVGIRTSGFAHWFRSHFCLSHCCRDTPLTSRPPMPPWFPTILTASGRRRLTRQAQEQEMIYQEPDREMIGLKTGKHSGQSTKNATEYPTECEAKERVVVLRKRRRAVIAVPCCYSLGDRHCKSSHYYSDHEGIAKFCS